MTKNKWWESKYEKMFVNIFYDRVTLKTTINTSHGVTSEIVSALNLDRACFPTFRRYTQVGHDNLHGVRLDPEDVARHSFVVQRFGSGDDACLVVDLKMTWKHRGERVEKMNDGIFNSSCVGLQPPLVYTPGSIFKCSPMCIALICCPSRDYFP